MTRYIISVLTIFLSTSLLYSQIEEENKEINWNFNNDVTTFSSDEHTINNIQSISEILEYLHDNPIKINTDESIQLYKMGLINFHQYKSLKAYIITYGTLLSPKELILIPHWNRSLIEKLQPYIDFTISHQSQDGSIFKRSRHKILSRYFYDNSQTKTTDNIGNQSYIGIKYNMEQRYMKAGFTLEKDPGESIFLQNKKALESGNEKINLSKGFDHIAGYIELRGKKLLKKFIIGNYYMNYGEGLHIQSSPVFGKSLLVTDNFQQNNTVRGTNTFSEYGSFRGALANIALKPITINLFWSNQKEDATLKHKGDFTFFKSFYNTGLHKTFNEISKKDNVSINTIGGHISYEASNYNLGVTMSNSRMSVPMVCEDQKQLMELKKQSIDKSTLISVNHIYIYNKFLSKGEVAYSMNNAIAIQQSLKYIPKDQITFSLGGRYHTPEYYSIYSNSASEYHTTNNEGGYYLTSNFCIGKYINAYLFYDQFFRLNTLQKKENSQEGYEFLFHLNFCKSRRRTFELTYRHKSKDKVYNSPLQKEYSYKDHGKSSLKLTFNLLVHKQINIKLFSIVQWKDKEENKDSKGICNGCYLKYKSKNEKLQFSNLFCYHSSRDRNYPFYIFMNSMTYNWGFTSLYGSGFINNSIVKYKVSKRFKAELQYKKHWRKEDRSPFRIAFQLIYKL
ncbi:MAG: hypothetical protein ACEPOV_05815 [Hyphomicrobiales bacterium]